MAIQMIASKRFRLPQGDGFVWIDEGDPYEVATEAEAKFHERGRGKRVKAESKEAKK